MISSKSVADSFELDGFTYELKQSYKKGKPTGRYYWYRTLNGKKWHYIKLAEVPDLLSRRTRRDSQLSKANQLIDDIEANLLALRNFKYGRKLSDSDKIILRHFDIEPI